MSEGRTGKPIQGELLAYLSQHDGHVVYLGVIAEALYETLERVQAGINNLRHRMAGGYVPGHIETVIRGRAWRYTSDGSKAESHPLAGTADVVFDLIGESKSGELILSDPKGRLYRATEL